MATMNLRDSTYERLNAKAAARRLSLEDYLDELANQNARPSLESARQLAALESFSAGMVAWVSAHLPPAHVVDDSRETIYEGRGAGMLPLIP